MGERKKTQVKVRLSPTFGDPHPPAASMEPHYLILIDFFSWKIQQLFDCKIKDRLFHLKVFKKIKNIYKIIN